MWSAKLDRGGRAGWGVKRADASGGWLGGGLSSPSSPSPANARIGWLFNPLWCQTGPLKPDLQRSVPAASALYYCMVASRTRLRERAAAVFVPPLQAVQIRGPSPHSRCPCPWGALRGGPSRGGASDPLHLLHRKRRSAFQDSRTIPPSPQPLHLCILATRNPNLQPLNLGDHLRFDFESP